MHEDIEETIEVPEKVNASLNESEITIAGPKGEMSRKFPMEMKLEGKKISISAKNGTRDTKRMINTQIAHIKNMIHGVQEGYKYNLQICSVHFPMTVAVVKNTVVIKNFLGEVGERVAKILPKVELKVEGEFIRIFSIDKEAAGQTAANLETATKVRNRDRRVFQDGIWITEKPEDME